MAVKTPIPDLPVTPEDRLAYLEQLRQLLPRGPAMRVKDESVFSDLQRGLAAELARIDTRLKQLQAEIDPRTTVELLPEWAKFVGLPDPCEETPATDVQLRAAVVAKLGSLGGQSLSYFLEVAARLGYSTGVKMEDHKPFVVGSKVGDRLYNGDWRFTWTVRAPAQTPIFFTIGASAIGDHLTEWSNELLECVLKEIKPAHTIVRFVYDQPWTGWAPWEIIYPTPLEAQAFFPAPAITDG